VASVHLVTTLADIQGDRAQGLNTSGVALGRRRGLLVSIVLMLVAAGLSLLVNNRTALYATLLSLPFFLIPALETKAETGGAGILLPAKTSVIIFSVIAGIIFRLYLPALAAVILITRAYYRRRFGINYPSLR
jgi:4-hydroxybenzoate polyprenyltransferase